MRTAAVLEYVTKDVETAFKKARIDCGNDATSEELKKWRAEKVLYWINKPTIEDTNRVTFITVRIANVSASGKADAKTAFHNVIIYLDIVTLKIPTDKKLLNMIDEIEKQFDAIGYEFEMNQEAELDETNKRTIWSFKISKRI